eukprot:2821952-Rhodomonas_salina.2
MAAAAHRGGGQDRTERGERGEKMQGAGGGEECAGRRAEEEAGGIASAGKRAGAQQGGGGKAGGDGGAPRERDQDAERKRRPSGVRPPAPALERGRRA